MSATSASQTHTHFHEPFLSDASGLIVKAEGPDFRTFVIRRILPDSPAENAGFRVGDIVVAVDGAHARNLVLWKIMETLTHSGETHTLTFHRDGKSFDLGLQLSSLLP